MSMRMLYAEDNCERSTGRFCGVPFALPFSHRNARSTPGSTCLVPHKCADLLDAWSLSRVFHRPIHPQETLFISDSTNDRGASAADARISTTDAWVELLPPHNPNSSPRANTP